LGILTVLSKSRFSSFRKAAFFGGVATLAMAGLAGFGQNSDAQAREAAGLFAQFQPRDRVFLPQNNTRQQPSTNRLRQAPKQAGKGSPKQAEKKGPPPPPGPHLLIVSIKSQRVTLYANGKPAATSPVSSGTPQNPTPHGVFSIIQRNRHHRSNIYSGAPMPYMQRLTWSGIALHQGVLPGRPASHGCIRLPESFASFLWNTTKMNTRVIVARDDVEPQDIVHAKLFQPKPVPTTVESPMPGLRKTFDTTHPAFVRTAGMQMVITDANVETGENAEDKPLTTVVAPSDEAARESVAEPVLQSAPVVESATPEVADVKPAQPQAPAAEPAKQEVAAPQSEPAKIEPARPELAGSEPGKAEPKIETEIESKIEAKSESQPEITASAFPQRADIPEAILASFEKSLVAKEKRTSPKGPISVFISRKDKRLYVRQTFIPLFTAPVTFKDENVPFGTHVFTAYEKDGGSLRWTAVTMPAEAPAQPQIKTMMQVDARGRRVEVPVKPHAKQQLKPVETHAAAPSAASVLDRIEIAQDVSDRISEYVSSGASLIVSDHGIGDETGLYTDFIVVTKK
jgi:lipoprotein-anchoring transpeptidase ErfK/SrfK